MATGSDPEVYAQRWVNSWNSRDLDTILAEYAPNVVFRSPIAAQVVPGSDGTIRGVGALRSYWESALARNPDLRFELREAFYSPGAIAVRYETQQGVSRLEVLSFVAGQVSQGWGFLPAT
jgi:hypothetical protein